MCIGFIIWQYYSDFIGHESKEWLSENIAIQEWFCIATDMESAPYQDYYCNSHNVNTPVCECKYIFTNTWTDLFWGKKSCREVRREKNIPQSIEKVQNIPHSRFLGKKILAEQKTTSPFLAWEQQTYFRSSLLSLRKVIFRRERGVDRTYVCCSQQATPASKVKWSAAKGRSIR